MANQISPDEYRKIHLPKILRQIGSSTLEAFRWTVERYHLIDAADEIDRLRSELEAERAYSANLREEIMIELWIARDGDGDLYAFTEEPSWNESNEVWEPNGDSALLDMDQDWLGQIRPGEALRFAPTTYGYKRYAVKGEHPKCTCGADSDPGACGHHPLCPCNAKERM